AASIAQNLVLVTGNRIHQLLAQFIGWLPVGLGGADTRQQNLDIVLLAVGYGRSIGLCGYRRRLCAVIHELGLFSPTLPLRRNHNALHGAGILLLGFERSALVLLALAH